MSSFIDLLISLILVFFLLSMLVSCALEILTTWWSKTGRAAMLYHAILKVFNDKQNKNWADGIYQHPLIEGTKRNWKSLPSYIEPATFSSALVDVVTKESKRVLVQYNADGKASILEWYPKREDLFTHPPKPPKVEETDPFERFRNGVLTMKSSDVKYLLESYLSVSKDIPSLRQNIEVWYNGYMERVSGWYKRQVRLYLFIISLVVTLAMNINAIRVVKTLWADDALRASFVQQAILIAGDTTALNPCAGLVGDEKVDCLFQRSSGIYQELKSSTLPIGWTAFNNPFKKSWGDFLLSCVGWLITTVLLMQGAPFWFQLLTRLVNIRGTGKRPPTDND
ncbi:MAG: hypothetical protein ACOYXT_29350 [Bacteroidota bacterium]